MTVDIRRDCRLSLDDNWLVVEIVVEEAAQRNLTITPISVFHPVSGVLIGWKLPGWEPLDLPVVIHVSESKEVVNNEALSGTGGECALG